MAHIEEEPQTRAPDRKNPLEGQGQGKVGKKARRALLAVLAVLAVAGGYGVYLSEKRVAEGGIPTPSPVTATAPEGTLPPLPSEGEIFPFKGITTPTPTENPKPTKTPAPTETPIPTPSPTSELITPTSMISPTPEATAAPEMPAYETIEEQERTSATEEAATNKGEGGMTGEAISPLKIEGEFVSPSWDEELKTWVWEKDGEIKMIYEKTTGRVMAFSRAGRLIYLTDASYGYKLDISKGSPAAADDLIRYWAREKDKYYGSSDSERMDNCERVFLVLLPSGEFNKDPLDPQWEEEEYMTVYSPGHRDGYSVGPVWRENGKEAVLIYYLAGDVKLDDREGTDGSGLMTMPLYLGLVRRGGGNFGDRIQESAETLVAKAANFSPTFVKNQ